MFITNSQRHQLGDTWKWTERKCQLHVQRHWTWKCIFALSNFAWLKIIWGRGKGRMSQKVRYLSWLFRNINMEPHENMQKGSVKVSGTCSKSQNLPSYTCSVKICVTHECKNICVTHESETSIWKHMKISRKLLFFFWNEHKRVQDTCWETHDLKSCMNTLNIIIGVTPSSKGRVEGGEGLK